MTDNIINKNIDLTIKAEEVGKDGAISAYLTTFDNADVVGDIMDEKCLDDFIKSFDPNATKLTMLYEHETSKIIGEWIKLEKDANGIIGHGILYNDVSLAKDVQALLKRGAVGSVSIGFRSSDFEKNDQGGRTFKSIELVETSVVLRPANSNAQVISVKNENDGMIEVKKLKSLLKEAGLSRNEIDALFFGGFTGLKNLREEEDKKEVLISALKNFKL